MMTVTNSRTLIEMSRPSLSLSVALPSLRPCPLTLQLHPCPAIHCTVAIRIVLPPLLSHIAAAIVHGNSHCTVAVVLPSIALPPLLPIKIVPPLSPSPIMTHVVPHHHHHCPSQSPCYSTIHCAVAAITDCYCATIMPPCVTS
jgi:hypothetical protein